MGQRYAGRHRDASTTFTAATTHPVARHRLPAKLVRRPLLTAGTAVALVGTSAVGFAKAGHSLSDSSILAATFTVSAAAISQASANNNELQEQKAYRDKATEVTTMRASYAADAAKAAAAALVERANADAAAQAATLAAQRQADADRVSRDAQRVALVANAQNDPKAVARAMLGDHGWSDGEWSCLEQLWVGESGWNYRAANPSGAYGIPQSLPASKMASVGADYQTNPVTQITWGMNYIKNSYGSPCNALATWNSRSPHWY